MYIFLLEGDHLFPPYMEGFVITGVLKPLNLARRVDGVAFAIICILMDDEDHFAMIGTEEAAQVTMSKPGSSWLPMPVTETVCPVLSKILTSEPARPPLAPLSIRDP